jgi:hypothetical protein
VIVNANVWVQAEDEDPEDGFLGEGGTLEVLASDTNEIALYVKWEGKTIASAYITPFQAGQLSGVLEQACEAAA